MRASPALCCAAAAAAAPPPRPTFGRKELVSKRVEELPRANEGAEPYKVMHFNQTLDHFNIQHNATFQQRYLVNDSSFKAGGPIFAFTGAEGGAVTGTFYSMGWPFQMCQTLGGLCIFMEMRFFGTTHPFGDFPDGRGRGPWIQGPEGVGMLSVEQAMADYAALLSHVRDEYKAWDSPVVTFGGSLSGTVAALMRMRHPEVVDMAYAASAPILGWVGMQDQFSFRKRVKDTYDLLAPGCAEVVRQGFVGHDQLDSQAVHDIYRTCEPPDADNKGTVQGVAWGQLEGGAFGAYPPEFSTLKQACDRMEKVKDQPQQIFAALLDTPKDSCFNLTEHRQSDNSSNSKGWAYLACTEVMHPTGCNNVTDFFPPFNYSADAYAPGCRHDFGHYMVPRPDQIPNTFSLFHTGRIKRYSHILFSYGSFDPWATMGIHTSLSDTLPVIVIPNATHCDDTLEPSSYDTEAMDDARAKELAILRGWISEFSAKSRRA